ncbi:hypothetical protein OIE66_09275 [Nonomuraea sp. NBC_01738]|uniref:hypothetical protein n=1 Tax=Nonomuraea sp. NBC_01738 TaxID=2976003 RepID=UPI002E119542|nr:hypothetical protein OIE66_09275 [Nonomuraea sp. NBC_01738]
MPPEPEIVSQEELEEEFRAWERRGARWEEFWKDRPDEADPEARISARSVLRVGVLVGAGVLVAGLAWSGIHAQQRPAAVTDVAASAPRPLPTLTLTDGPDIEVPPDDSAREGDPTGPLEPGDPTGGPTGPMGAHTGDPATPQDDDPARPDRTTPPATTKATGRPTTKPATDGRPTNREPVHAKRTQDPPAPRKEPTSGPTEQPVAKKVELPKPPPPSASLSSSSASLGSGRSGAFGVSCTGSCQVTSASGSSGISVSGSSYTVGAPASRPGCPGPATTESGTITVSWSGTATGDGTTTAGTTSGSGTLTMNVSWTVTKDKGTFVPDMKGGGYWSNCSPNSADY